MSYKAIACDWNGTLFYDANDSGIHREFAQELLKYRFKDIFSSEPDSFKKFMELLDSCIQICKKYKEYNRIRSMRYIELEKRVEMMKKVLNDIYKILNENILIGRDIEFVNRVIWNYAERNKEKVDDRIAKPVRKLHSKGKETFIISGSYQDCIKKVLELSGYYKDFDEIIGTKIHEYCGIVTNLEESSRTGKTQLFIDKFLINRGFKEQEIVYLGDSEFDLEIGRILPSGNFIASFFSDDEFKELASRYCKAFVPESEEDLLKYLESKA